MRVCTRVHASVFTHASGCEHVSAFTCVCDHVLTKLWYAVAYYLGAKKEWGQGSEMKEGGVKGTRIRSLQLGAITYKVAVFHAVI